jgi:hypothetical protein
MRKWVEVEIVDTRVLDHVSSRDTDVQVALGDPEKTSEYGLAVIVVSATMVELGVKRDKLTGGYLAEDVRTKAI